MTRKIKYPNGDVYIGDAVGLFKPVREGFGTLTNRRGDVYEGEWKDDKRQLNLKKPINNFRNKLNWTARNTKRFALVCLIFKTHWPKDIAYKHTSNTMK